MADSLTPIRSPIVEADAPNVLVIMSDQHNAGVMGCAGDTVVQTPNLDRLAERGALLSNLYCQAPLCAPSRMSFLTGMLPSQCGVTTNDHIPNSQHPTYAHAAGAAGYRPHLIGKLHAKGPDQLLGFADRQVGEHGPNYQGVRPPQRGVLDRAMGHNMTSLAKIGVGRNAYQVKDEYVAEAAVSYLRQHAIEQWGTSRRQPFFLSIGLMLPHQPYVARREDYERYEGKVEPPRVPRAVAGVDDHPFLSWWRSATGLTTGVAEATAAKARTAYWAMVDRMDRIIGTVLDTLDELGLADNTLVVYTSDHGDHIGEHGLWWKQTLLEPAVKVPGILTWPGVVPAGTHCERVAGLVDLMATLIDAMGAPSPPRSVGRSMLSMLAGTDSAWEDVAIAEHCIDQGGLDALDVAEGHYQRMIRAGRYKYIDHGHLPPLLFDLHNDPDETRNLAGEPALADVIADMAARVRDGWDPERVKAETRTRLGEVQVILGWARHVQPPDRHRWELNPDYNALDEPETVPETGLPRCKT